MAASAELIEVANAVNTVWVLLCGALIFFMQAGFAMLEAGSIRRKNVKNVLLKNFIDASSGALGFFLFGFAFAYGNRSDRNTFVGGKFFALSEGFDDYLSWFFQWAFAATAATIVGGSVAERTSFEAYLLYSFFLTSWVYPVVVHWVWDGEGWISAFNNDPFNDVGMIDFAGSGVVHMVGGLSGLIGSKIVGPRQGRFDANGNACQMPGHNAALSALGTFILWFGWYGFNCGSTLGMVFFADDGAFDGSYYGVAAKVAVTTTLAAASGALTCLFLSRAMNKEWDLEAVLNGALGGLVAITASCSVVEPYAAMVIGVLAGIAYLFSSRALLKAQIDDPIDAAPVHFVCGALGVILTGFFANETDTVAAYGRDQHYGLLYGGGGKLLANQIIGVLAITAWVIAMMAPFFLLLRSLKLLRISAAEEESGMDFSKHGGHAYPEEMKREVRELVHMQHVSSPDEDGKRVYLDQFGNEHRF